MFHIHIVDTRVRSSLPLYRSHKKTYLTTSVRDKEKHTQYRFNTYKSYDKHFMNLPLHTLLELQLHWAPPLAPFPLQELSTYRDVDYC